MGKLLPRENDFCLNCGAKVPERYCTVCGQENVEVRKTFVHLITHFVEDFTHYDNAFWKTIRFLLFRPARLTREYLLGRRRAFVTPIRLYIFINFLTFFLLAVLPSHSNSTLTIKAGPNNRTDNYETDNNSLQIGEYRTVREFDSILAITPEEERNPQFLLDIERRLAKVNENTPQDELRRKVGQGMIRNLPKALFIYMPIFAFGLWLFHGKKRWFYYDHAIFTLHYFSFMLLTYSIVLLITRSIQYIDFLSDFDFLLGFAMMCWWFFYFFISHRRMYGEKQSVSIAKGLALFIINIVIVTFLTVVILIYSVLTIDT